MQRARMKVQSKAGTFALSLLPSTPNSGSVTGRASQKLVTRCLLPTLLLALSDRQLFNQLVIALSHVRGSGRL